MQWYVDSKRGDDANDGKTAETPFASLQHVVHVAGAGDAVLVAPGTYDQNLPKQISVLRQANVVVAVLGGH
jgi:Protein of unknown function (DUF1565)